MNKKFCTVIFFLAVVILLTACMPPTQVQEGQPSSQGQTISLGDWSYIPLDLPGTIRENFTQIEAAVSQWEAENESRQIVGFQIDYQSYPSLGSGVKGVVIYSRPR